MTCLVLSCSRAKQFPVIIMPEAMGGSGQARFTLVGFAMLPVSGVDLVDKGSHFAGLRAEITSRSSRDLIG